jgi:acyl-CoA thioesterase-1
MANKKIWLGMLVMVLVFGLTVVGCNDGSTNGNSKDITLVCLGDSLTAGYGATTPGVDDKSKSYPAYLQKKANITVINAGVSGDTTAQGLARVDSDVLSHNPDIVIILLAGNDVGSGVPISTIQANLQSIINKVANGNRKIFLAQFSTKEMATAMGVPPATIN